MMIASNTFDSEIVVLLSKYNMPLNIFFFFIFCVLQTQSLVQICNKGRARLDYHRNAARDKLNFFTLRNAEYMT